MSKQATYPPLYDGMKVISLSFLVKHSYLEPHKTKSGSIHWSNRGEPTGNIGIKVERLHSEASLQLDYKCNGKPISYSIEIISKPSNLGVGLVWFFKCPHTGKHCRKLYLGDSLFLHRTAFLGCMYEKQTKCKGYRRLDKSIGVYFKIDELYELIYSKHFKKHYKGKPTKRYLKTLFQIQVLESKVQ
jgi:hypothetical protein